MGIRLSAVAKAWREYRIQPWRADALKFVTHPELVAKVTYGAGLYLDPPENAAVLCPQPMLPMQPGLHPQCTHHYVRDVTTTLKLATGQVTGIQQDRHRHQAFLHFLRHLARAYLPATALGDNYAAHRRVEIGDWLAANPRIQVHCTPTSASWTDLVEVWSGIKERHTVRRGALGHVRELTTSIKKFITGWNGRARPFGWTTTPDQILETANRHPTSTTTKSDGVLQPLMSRPKIERAMIHF